MYLLATGGQFLYARAISDDIYYPSSYERDGCLLIHPCMYKTSSAHATLSARDEPLFCTLVCALRIRIRACTGGALVAHWKQCLFSVSLNPVWVTPYAKRRFLLSDRVHYGQPCVRPWPSICFMDVLYGIALKVSFSSTSIL